MGIQSTFPTGLSFFIDPDTSLVGGASGAPFGSALPWFVKDKLIYMTHAIAHVTVGVAALQPVFDLWIGRFGLEVVARRSGADPGLAALWSIPADNITEQILIRTPGADTGYLHFVQFNEPDPPVREGAGTTDLGPKNLDVNCVDMPARHAELQAAGCTFRSGISEYRVDDIHAREVQMPSHDETNIVLIEILSGGFDLEYSPTGFAAITSFVIIVPDTHVEAEFYRRLFGLDEIMHHRITGPGIEEAVGLPKGAALDMRLMGREGHFFGRAELIQYEGLQGMDRFPLARAPALGTLHCSYAVDSVSRFLAHTSRLGVKVVAHDAVDTIFGSGKMCTVFSPAGLRIVVFEG